ncbi:Ribonuclease [Phytophthora megakarya]|uniref:Ribonuclease n=1 Tax=Phytophthora megakarya TaxID=4795 RepID=A0A225UK68_9STRA|nr:Ribonuclease [Phytophthora megakarya]
MSDKCYVGVLTYYRYLHFQLVLDEASKYLWGFLLHRKEESTAVALRHLQWLLAQGQHIKVFSSDQGRELLNAVMKTLFVLHGIEYIWTNAYSSEENVLVEKMNGIVMARDRCLLSATNMPMVLWGEAFRFVIDVLNIIASTTLGGDTPYSRRLGLKPMWLRYARGAQKKSGKPELLVRYGEYSESCRIVNLPNGNVSEVHAVKVHKAWTADGGYVRKLQS